MKHSRIPTDSDRHATEPVVSAVVNRRLKSGNIFRTASAPITFKEPGRWEVRWTNTSLSPDHLWDRIHNKGWIYATPEMIATNLTEIGAELRDGRIVRGARGQEVLMVMARRDYQAIQQQKTDQVILDTFGKNRLKERMASETAAQFGPAAGDFIARHVKDMKITDRRGPATLDEADDLSLVPAG